MEICSIVRFERHEQEVTFLRSKRQIDGYHFINSALNTTCLFESSTFWLISGVALAIWKFRVKRYAQGTSQEQTKYSRCA